jgi:opacity protein-like surface antigen
MRATFIATSIALAALLAAPAAAQEPGPFSLRGGLGFTAGPETFLLTLEAPITIGAGFGAGPLLQLGLSDDDTIVAPTANVTYAFDLSGASNRDVRKLAPFVQTGIGFAYIEKDHRRGDDDDIGFLFNVGGGIEYSLTDRIAVGSNMLFNVLPDSVVGENFFFSWQVGTIRVRF